MWANSKDHSIFFKLGQSECEALAPANAGKYKYEIGWKQGVFRLEQDKAGIVDYEVLMDASVKRFVGVEAEP